MSTDFNGKNYDDQFVGDLVGFVANDKFQTMFENFFLEHALEFTGEEEHKLEYYEIYQRFHDMFEQQLEIFCAQKEITEAEFMRRCRAATTEDPKAKHYINILMSSVEYTTFVKLMQIMRPVAEQRMIIASGKTGITAGRKVDQAKSSTADVSASSGAKGESFKDMHDAPADEKAAPSNDADIDLSAGAKGSGLREDDDIKSASK